MAYGSIFRTPPPCPGCWGWVGGGWWAIFENVHIGGTYLKLRWLWGWFFSGGTWKLCIKNSEYESLTKNDSKYSFYNLSLLLQYPNNFLVVCIYILISHGTYILPPLQIETCFDTVCPVWTPKKPRPNNISSSFLRSSTQ